MSTWKDKGEIEILFLIGIVLISLFLAGDVFTKSTVQLTPDSNNIVNVDQNSPGASTASQNLQLQTFNGTAITPSRIPTTPNNSTTTNITGGSTGSPTYPATCGVGATGVEGYQKGPNGNDQLSVLCSDGCIADGALRTGTSCCPGSPQMRTGGSSYADGTVIEAPIDWCDAKPVIYLYPQKVASVSVSVQIPGVITTSIPEYGNGWNVIANPDGTLISNGQKYSELFYETSQTAGTPPSKGWIIKKNELKTKLTEVTTKLGLNTKEQNEFLSYWLPRLNSLNKPYYFVSFFPNKDEIDKVTITPNPDNFIQFIMYFKGLNKKINVTAPIFPTVPQRTGFTAVEWGGIVDSN